MNTNFILTSIREDLFDVDKASLRMSGIMVTDSLTEGIQPLLEHEASCLLLTDKIIEEQSSLSETVKNIKILFDIYPKQIRIIYVKRGSDKDTLVELMDDYSNWDVYYNQELPNILTEDIIEMFQNRKIPSNQRKLEQNKNIKNSMIKRANTLSKELIEELKEMSDIEKNTGFKSLIMRNMNMVRDLVVSYEELKRDLKDNEHANREKDVYISKLSEDYKEARRTNNLLQETIANLEENRKVMHKTIRQLQSTYNTLVDKLKEVVNVGEIHTSLSAKVNADKYRYKAPLIVYFKEYTTMNYFTTFLKGFNDILINSMGLSRVLVIENDLHTSRIPLYHEKNFVHVSDGTNMNKIVLGNLVCCGNNPKLLNYLVQNSLSLDLLLIYDRTGHHSDLIEGSDVIKFNLVRSLDDAKALGLEDHNLVSNQRGSDYHVETIRDFNRIKGNEDLELSIISSLDLTKKLITYIKGWEEALLVEGAEYERQLEDITPLKKEPELTEV